MSNMLTFGLKVSTDLDIGLSTLDRPQAKAHLHRENNRCPPESRL